MKAEDLLRALRRLARRQGLAFSERDGKGSHLVVRLGKQTTVVPRHRGDLRTGTYRAILRDLGLRESDLED